MLLTKENLLRFIKEKKAVTPTMVSQAFETTTIIASAALSELANEKLIQITNLKIGSTPYYYDPKQNEILQKLAQKHLKKNELELIEKLQKNKIIPENNLSIQERLLITKIKDFAKPLELTIKDKRIKFWIWYLEDKTKIRNKILSYLQQKENKTEQKKEKKRERNLKIQNQNEITNKIEQNEIKLYQEEKKEQNFKHHKNIHNETKTETDIENKIENYFSERNLKIETKNRTEKGIYYRINLTYNEIRITIESYCYYKKPKEIEIIEFYTSSLCPKILFIKNPAKKILTLSKELKNLTIIEL